MYRSRSVSLLLLLFTSSLFSRAWTQPCTLYKAKDIQNARENIEKHPWARRYLEIE